MRKGRAASTTRDTSFLECIGKHTVELCAPYHTTMTGNTQTIHRCSKMPMYQCSLKGQSLKEQGDRDGPWDSDGGVR